MLRQAGWFIDDSVTSQSDPDDPSLNPRHAYDVTGHQERGDGQKVQRALDLLKSLGAMPPAELRRLELLEKNASTHEDYILQKRLTDPGRQSVPGTSGALLNAPGEFGGTIRKGIDMSRDREGKWVASTGDDLIAKMMVGVRKAEQRERLEFSAVYGGGRSGMTVNRMLADSGDHGREGLVQKLNARDRPGTEIHKLLQ
jgi:hypothetical protein